ncbi:MAG: hypothetical protein GY851_14645 [bacterium]|nr:hypothetical protein [bacterium]
MSLLGIDVGTTGCKSSAFAEDGTPIATAYEEYDAQRPQPGWAELDAVDVWAKVKATVATVAAQTKEDPVAAVSVSSLGEAAVPVSSDRRILGPSILNFDVRGEEYLEGLAESLDAERLFDLNGNTLGNHYALTKLIWLKDHDPGLYAKADAFLLWAPFVAFMLGAEPVADYSLANRTLLFDLDSGDWSDELLAWSGLDRDKLPATAPSGTVIGSVSDAVADELGLPRGVSVATGAHDQCANGVGCGVTEEGRAMIGMGTYICIMPVYGARKDAAAMMPCGLNTEHHAAPGAFVSFIYNHGGSMLKWYRDTFAAEEHRHAQEQGDDIYAKLIAETPEGPSSVMVLPHFAATGPPDFITDSSGVITGLKLETTRGDVLKGILEGAVFYLRECVDSLAPAGIRIDEYRAVGGGSKSDVWLQATADILDRPITRPRVTEAGTLGAAILAGAATDVFKSVTEGTKAMVRLDKTFEPNAASHDRYDPRYQTYKRLWPTMKDWLTSGS